MKKNGAESCSGKEIAGVLKMMMMKKMTRKS